MQFSTIPGLHELKSQLIAAYQRGKIPHAQLFVGRPHTAVLPMALAYISYLMCENKSATDSCGTCANCIRINKLIHPDIHLHFPKISAAENKYEKNLSEAIPKFREFVLESPFGNLEDWTYQYGQENKNLLISREDSRQMLKSVSMRSVEGGYKILLIWYPELMNPSAANAILKILEEPPEKTLYMLVSYSYDSLLATITSRTQLINVPPNTYEEIASYLVDKGIESARAEQIAKLSEGKVGLAEYHAEIKESQEYEDFQKWMLACWNKNLTDLVRRSEEFSKSGKAIQKSSLNYAISIIRNAVIHASGQKPLVQSELEQSFIQKYSDKLGLERLEKVYVLSNEALIHLERNSNPRITHLNLSLDIIQSISG
ncbi:MAG: DNA polymerase III subunit delta [Bacteroidota bacterium]